MTEILRENCNERDGDVVRVVREEPPSPEWALGIYDRLKGITNLFSGKKVAPPETLRRLVGGEDLYFLVDNVGIICVAGVRDAQAHVHITFWDKRLRGRERLCRRMCEYVLDRYSLEHLWTILPMEARATTAFARRVGFTELYSTKLVVALKIDRADLHRANQELEHGR